MFPRSPSFIRRFVPFAGAPLLAFVGLLACGRSDLDDYQLGDGGSVVPEGGFDVADVQAPDNGACNASTCPTGCCDPGGQCAPGSASTACGTLGEACQSCPAEGFQLCDPTRHACGNQVASCDATNCGGCCEGNVCFAGSDPNECGQGGQSCAHCQSSGLACLGEQCVEPACGSETCSGCCFGEQCVAGTDQTACGAAGAACGNCLASGGSCVPQVGAGGVCEAGLTCNSGNCPGCCVGSTCFVGTDANECGTGGQACQSCEPLGVPCVADGAMGGQCAVPPSCNSTSCQGCCDLTGTCQPGFIDVQCGQSGVSCEDCTQLAPASTCDTGVSPRTCQSQQTQCPAPYPSCPSGLETPSPVPQSACSPTELENAGAACAAGAHSAVCNAFFSVEQADDPACAACLGVFDFDFAELTGLATCVAPFSDAACDHTTACVVDCTQKACAQCADAAALAQCRSQVPGGVCATYYDGAQCVANAFVGAGNFCAPDPGAGGFGNWLATVGQFYCGSLQP